MVAVGRFHLPEALQIARQRSRRADHNGVILNVLVDNPQNASLSQPRVQRFTVFRQLRIKVPGNFRRVIRAPLARPQPAALLVPGRFRLRHLVSPAAAIILKPFRQRRQTGAGIGHQRRGVQFEGIELGDIQQEKFYVRVCKQRFRTGGEIGQTRADADNQIGLRRKLVCRQPAGNANTAQIQRMVADQRAFPGLRFRKRQVQVFHKLTKRVVRAGITHPAAANHQRALFTGNQRPRLRQPVWVRRASFNMVNTTGKETLRVIPGFALHILR